MSKHEPILRAFGGGPLEGDRWVRVLYLDESGIGKISSDPIIVVAGVVIHADTQWGTLAKRLEGLLTNAVPPGAKRPRYLHAKDIFHGSGEFPRETWDLDRRNKLLFDVGSVVTEFQLPVVWTAADRKKYAREHPGESPAERLQDIYTVCSVACFLQTEAYMRQSHTEAEVCSIVMEQNQQLQKRIPEVMAFLRNPEEHADELDEGWQRVMPLKKLIDTPACQPKTGSSILQLADYCAFAIKRFLQGSAGAARLTRPLAPHLLRYMSGMDKSKPIYWNPVHMPSAWKEPVEFKDGKFRKVSR